jgi:hypothetical protein
VQGKDVSPQCTIPIVCCFVVCCKSCFYSLVCLRFDKIYSQLGDPYFIRLKHSHSKKPRKICLRFKKSFPQ